jgi:hypothetical protein
MLLQVGKSYAWHRHARAPAPAQAHLVIHLRQDLIRHKRQRAVIIQQEAVAGAAAVLYHGLLHAAQHLQDRTDNTDIEQHDLTQISARPITNCGHTR